MRIVVPAVPGMLKPETLPAILASGWHVDVVPMLGLESYFELMGRLWGRAETFAIVEQDILVGPDSLIQLFTCSEPWCAFSYEVFAGDVATAYGHVGALGCARFRRSMMIEHPEAVLEAGKMDLHPVHPPRSYAVMDATLSRWLQACGYRPHQHLPNVEHLHHYNRADAYVPPAVASPHG